MQKVLLIEDAQDIQALVKALLSSRYHLIIAPTAAEAMNCLESHSFDLVLMDVNLPDRDGFQLCSELRALPRLKHVPLVFLTGKSGINDRVAGFALGADDYIVKPFEPLEFRARVEAKLTVQLSRKQDRDVVKKGRIELDRSMFKAFVVDESGKSWELGLTPHEFRLLTYFVTHEAHVVSRDQLMSAVWGSETHVLDRTIDRHISTLRRKLSSEFEKIEAVPGVGYRFVTVAK